MTSGGILVVGDVIRDDMVQLLEPFSPGGDTAAKIRTAPGGSGANQAAWLGAAGAKVRFVGRAGGDADWHARQLQRWGVDARISRDDQAETGRIVVVVDGDGERHMLTDRGANAALSAADLPSDVLDGIGVLHLSGYSLLAATSREAVRGLVERARERGVRISLDPGTAPGIASAGAAAFRGWTRDIDLCVPSRDEAIALTGATSMPAAADDLLGDYRSVVIKLGRHGALLADRAGRHLEVPPLPARVVDTTGAGDAFCAGLLAGWVNGADLRECISAGLRLAADAITDLGARPRPGMGHQLDRSRN